jgi:hypothetical protein
MLVLFPSGQPALQFADGSPIPDDEVRYIRPELLDLRYGPAFRAKMAELLEKLKKVIAAA